MTSVSQQKPSVPFMLLYAWALITVIPSCLFVFGAVAALPALVFKLAGAQFLMLLLLGVAGLAALSLAICGLYGLARDWYIGWLVSRVSFYVGSFLLGLAVVVLVFNLPLNFTMLFVLLIAFALLKLSLACISSINTRDMRDRYSVVHYSHY